MVYNEQEVLAKLVSTNNSLVLMMTSDENTDVDITLEDGTTTTRPSFAKQIKNLFDASYTSLINDINDTKNRIDELLVTVQDIQTTVIDAKEEVATNTQFVRDAKDNIEETIRHADNVLLHAEQTLKATKTLGQEVNDYVGKMDRDYNAFLDKYREVLDIKTKLESLYTKTERLAWCVEADKKTVESYTNCPKGNLVKCYSSNGDGTFNVTQTCDFSAYHYYQALLDQVATVIPRCKEFIPLSYRNGDPKAIPVLGTPGDESIDLEKRDGTHIDIKIKGNP